MLATTQNRYLRYRHYFARPVALYKKKKTKVYTSIILSVLTIAFFGFFAIKPTLTTIGGLLKEIKDKKEVVTQMDKKIASLAQAQENYFQIEDKLYLIEQSLPQEPQLPTLIKQIESLARLSSVNLESVKIGKTNLQGETEETAVQETDLNLAVTGDYQKLKQFLNSLDTLRRVILIEDFAFKLPKTKESSVLILSVNAKAYYLTKNQ